MNNQIQIFTNSQFGEIRTCGTSEKPMFCLVDVCKALDINNPSQCKTRLYDPGLITNEVGVQTGTKRDGSPAIQKMKLLFIDEPNLYRCIFMSRKAEAEKFQDWVTTEVLPSIRKRGVYMTDEVAKRVIDNPTMLVDLAKDIREEHRLRVKAEKELLESKLVVAEQSEKIIDLSNHVDALKGKVAVLKSKADYYDIIKGADDLLCVSQIAAEYGKGGAEFNILLAEHGLQQKRTAGGQWLLHKEDLGKGYTGYATYWSKKKQKYCTSSLTKWTQSGKEHIYIVLKSHGILPLAEQPRQLTLFDNIQ